MNIKIKLNTSKYAWPFEKNTKCGRGGRREGQWNAFTRLPNGRDQACGLLPTILLLSVKNREE
jgi:hypothetical protein